MCTDGKQSVVAFVPARSGSKRVPHKNIMRFAGHPAMAYSICAARNSGLFTDVILCTDDPLYAEIGEYYGASVPVLRPPEISSSVSPDIEWVTFMLDALAAENREPDLFSILRPTNMFRRANTIARAYETLMAQPGADSLRAVSPVTEHPGKMWVVHGETMVPLMPLWPSPQPWHSQQMAALPQVFVQNASLEIAWTKVARADPPTIAGHVVVPFISEGQDGFDLNFPDDVTKAQNLISNGSVDLPSFDVPPFPKVLPTD